MYQNKVVAEQAVSIGRSVQVLGEGEQELIWLVLPIM